MTPLETAPAGATVTAPVGAAEAAAPPLKRPQESCAFVIFGASGDLTSRKLIPALYNLDCEDLLPREFATIGFAVTPMTDESFWAEKSRGAWLQDRRLRVSARRNLDDSVIATGIPFLGYGDMGEWTRIYHEIGMRVAGIRRFGAASLDLAWVAAGRYDGFWESNLKPWDTAAGCLLVREAGGFVSDYRGRSQPICDETVLAANDALHSKLHKLVATAIKG